MSVEEQLATIRRLSYSHSQPVHFFSDNIKLADDFAYVFKAERDEYVGEIYSVFLNIKNPIEIDLQGESYFGRGEEVIERAIEEVNENGNDGIILKNIKDRKTSLSSEIESNQFLAFNSNQIKSATGNIGTYSENPDIRFSIDESKLSKDDKRKFAREEYQSLRGKTTQAYVDKYHPLAVLERVIHGDVKDAAKSAWKMALMTNNNEQVMFHIIEKGGLKYDKATGEFSARKGVEGLKKILEPVKGKNYKNFENYAKSKSAMERWSFLRRQNFYTGANFYKTFGFSESDAKKWIAEGNDTSKTAFDKLQVFFQSNRDFMLETGLISETQHAALSKFKNYAPFFRVGEDLDAETQAVYDRAMELFPGGKGLSGRDAGVRKFSGSTRTTKNLVESIINQTQRLTDAGYKNIAAARSLNLMREIDLAQYLKQDSAQVRAKLEEMKKALEKQGIDVGDLSDEEIKTKVPIEAYFDITNDKDDNIVSVRVNGKLAFYKVEDPELLVAVKNLGGEKFNKSWNLLTGPKNFMTFAVTKLPQFAIRNFIRDTGSNAILFGGKTIAPYLGHTIKNLGKTMFADAHLQKLWASGAGGGSWYSVKAKDISADFKNDAWNKTKQVGKYAIKPLSWVLGKYERALQSSEQANRLSRFEQAKASGASDMEASFQAMDVLNFGMKGSGRWTGDNDWAKAGAAVFNAVVRITPFLNARIQGLYKLWREAGIQDGLHNQVGEISVKNRTRAVIQSLSKAVLMRGMMLATASVMYSIYSNNSEDDDGEKWYEKIPAHDKLNYWHFYIGNNNIIRIPKPFEIGYVFATIPEIFTDTIFQKRPDAGKVLLKGLTQSLEINPLANPIFDTIVEQARNKDSFSGRPIIEYADKELTPKYQYDADTSATTKAIANVFNGMGLGETWLASPARVQNVIGNFFCGMTKYITAMSDSVVESLTDIEGGTSRYARESVFEAPYSWATRNTRTMAVKNSSNFYEMRSRTREIYGATRLLRQQNKIEQLQDLIDRHKSELGNYNFVEAINTRLTEISRKRKALAERSDLTNAEIIQKDDELIAERNKLFAMTDILLDNVENKKFDQREFRDILRRIDNSGRDKKDSKKSQRLIRRLAEME